MMSFKFLAAIPLTIILAGCSLPPLDALFSQVANPINSTEVELVRHSLNIGLKVADNYAKLPRCTAGQDFTHNLCSTLSNVKQYDIAGHKADVAVTAAEDFVKNFPTLSASNVITAAKTALADFQNVEKAGGLK